MVWEESRKFRSRTGFSLELKNFKSKELVNPKRLALSKERWIHHKELREELRSRASWSHKWKPKNHHKQSTRRMRLKRNQIPGGHKEGRASFPIQSHCKDSKIHSSNPTPREGGRTEEREERRQGGGTGLAAREKREKWGSGREIFMPTTSRTKILNYP